MKFPTVSARLSLPARPGDPAKWTICEPTPAWRLSRSYLRHVADKRFSDTANLDYWLHRVFFDDLPGKAPRDRSRYVDALQVVSSHLSEQGAADYLVAELMELASGLRALDDGIVPYFLKPEKRAGAPPATGDIWKIKADLAIALDLFIEVSGATKANAVARLSERIEFMKHALLSRGDDFKGALAQWHSDFKGGVIADEKAQKHFNERHEMVEFYSRHLKTNDGRRIVDALVMDATLQLSRSVSPKQLADIVVRSKRAKG